MKLTKIFIFLTLIVVLTGCGKNNTTNDTKTSSINFFNWGDYIDPAIISDFTKETGIKVISDFYSSNEIMYTKLKSGGASYDVVIPSDYMIEKMIKEDMLEKIDMNNIPTFSNIDERFISRDFDKNNEYSVPYMWGTFGILYNKTLVSETVDSFDILWDPKYTGQIFMYESVRDTIGVALKKLGYSLNTTNPDELAEAKKILIEQKPLVQAYIGDTVKEKMIQAEGALAIVYSGDAMYSQNNNPDLEYAVPKEGSNGWYDAMVIPKDSKNKKEAEIFINYMNKPEIAARNSEYIGYSTANKAAVLLLPDELKNNPIYWPDDEIFSRCEIYKDLGEDIKLYDRTWTEILSAN